MHLVSVDERYFFCWHNCEVFIVLREERCKLYAKMPSLRLQNEPWRGLLVPSSPIFSHVSSLFVNYLPLTEVLYCAARDDHFVMVLVVFLQWVHPMGDFTKMSLDGHGPRMLESVYMGVLYPIPDAVVWFASTTCFHNIVD